MFRERMITSAIPERVFALCQMLGNKEILEKDIKEKIEPIGIGGKSSYFGSVRDAAKELGFISIKDGNRLFLLVDRKNVASMDEMRKYIVKHIRNIEDSLFYEVTQAYLELGIEVYKYISVTDKNLVELIGKKIGKNIYEDDMRAWRFWSSYLGFGYLHKINKAKAAELLVPNTMVYLKAVVDSIDIEKNKRYTMSEFMVLVSEYTDIVQKPEGKSLNLAFSYGLRGLHDTNKIILEHNMDSKNMWYLYKDEMHEIPSAISHITIRR